MTNKLKQKLKNNKGAAMILALTYTLVCSIIAVILLNSAQSNLSRVKSNRTSQQEYYSVDAAVRLISAAMQDGEFTCGRSTLEYDGGTPEQTSSYVNVNPYFLTCAKTLMEKIYYGTATGESAEYDISFSSEGMPGVLGKMILDISGESYNLTFKLWTSGQNGPADKVTMTFSPLVKTGETPTYSETIEVVNGGKTNEKTVVHTTVVTDYFCRVTWADPTITKGVQE